MLLLPIYLAAAQVAIDCRYDLLTLLLFLLALLEAKSHHLELSLVDSTTLIALNFAKPLIAGFGCWTFSSHLLEHEGSLTICELLLLHKDETFVFFAGFSCQVLLGEL